MSAMCTGLLHILTSANRLLLTFAKGNFDFLAAHVHRLDCQVIKDSKMNKLGALRGCFTKLWLTDTAPQNEAQE